MNPAYLAVVISFCSLLVAAISLGWNIYRDVIRKPKMRISMMAAIVVSSPRDKDHPRRLVVSITNFGPGKTKACLLHVRKTSWWRRLLKREVYAMLMHDYEDPLSGRLPAELDVGAKVDLTFRQSDDIFILKPDFNQIGISDPFGGVHWCTRREYMRIKKSYRAQNTATEKCA
jgi:hypothetical protein